MRKDLWVRLDHKGRRVPQAPKVSRELQVLTEKMANQARQEQGAPLVLVEMMGLLVLQDPRESVAPVVSQVQTVTLAIRVTQELQVLKGPQAH